MQSNTDNIKGNDSEAEERGFIVIDRPECLKCSHFAPGIATKAMDCTEENGNSQCPASQMSVVIGTNVPRAGAAIADSINTGDFGKAARLFKKLDSYHTVIQKQIMEVARSNLLTAAIASELGDTADHTAQGTNFQPFDEAFIPQPAAVSEPDTGDVDVVDDTPSDPKTVLGHTSAKAAVDESASWDD